jgi:hypothetical protein
VDNVSRFYLAQRGPTATHFALRWNGRERFTVSRNAAARKACWKVFRPGKLEYPLRAIAGAPRLLGAKGRVESEQLASVRNAIGQEAGESCCRAGTPGVWSKDTILLLDKRSTEPLYIVKAGAGEAVDLLLKNEANWLRSLRDQTSLSNCVPELVAHRSGPDLCFVAERPLTGEVAVEFGEPHVIFLRALQGLSRQRMPLEESRHYCSICSRMRDLEGMLSKTWWDRLQKGLRRIEESLSGSPLLFVAAHNDFTQWNIRVERGIAKVFDWEYADYEQLPLMDFIHFNLMPMALHRSSVAKMLGAMRKTLQGCRNWLGEEYCYKPEIQALAYLMNLCTLYLWSNRGVSESDAVTDSYAGMIDHLCLS